MTHSATERNLFVSPQDESSRCRVQHSKHEGGAAHTAGWSKFGRPGLCSGGDGSSRRRLPSQWTAQLPANRHQFDTFAFPYIPTDDASACRLESWFPRTLRQLVSPSNAPLSTIKIKSAGHREALLQGLRAARLGEAEPVDETVAPYQRVLTPQVGLESSYEAQRIPASTQ